MTQKDKLPSDFWDDADVAHPTDVNTFTVSMNADQLRMYVVAPELLPFAELIASIPIREQFGDDLPVVGIDGVMILQGHVRAARAAIAKAKGEAG